MGILDICFYYDSELFCVLRLIICFKIRLIFRLQQHHLKGL